MSSTEPVALPDFRNPGVIVRSLILAEGVKVVACLAFAPGGLQAYLEAFARTFLFEVSVLVSVAIIVLVSPALRSKRYTAAASIVVLLASATAMVISALGSELPGGGGTIDPWRTGVVAASLGGLILAYFNWRHRVLSPALVEARLLALQSRIRPHFLFNSLNAAVSLVREDPRLAERVLLDMCDLFRALIAESRSLVPVEDEIRLARSYLEIETLRLGDRLDVRWELDEFPAGVLVPVLLLQPLLENAVYHGIELRPEGGVISVRISFKGGALMIEVRNPLRSGAPTPVGNRMALANIRERLALHFDAEAQLRTSTTENEFVVTVTIPRGVRHGGAGEASVSLEAR